MRCRGDGDGAGLHPALAEMIQTGRGSFPRDELVGRSRCAGYCALPLGHAGEHLPGHFARGDFADRPWLRQQEVARRFPGERRRLQTVRRRRVSDRWLEIPAEFWRRHRVNLIAGGCLAVIAALYAWVIW